MSNPIIPDLTKGVKEVGKVIDDVHTSGEERGAMLTERLRIDMQSDSKIAKMARPIALYTVLGVHVGIVIASFFEIVVPQYIVTDNALLLGGIISFYFTARGIEKIKTRNANAVMEVEKLKLKHQQKMEKKRFRKKRNRNESAITEDQ